jgi:peptidyl-Asp metalloendopeptidase
MWRILAASLALVLTIARACAQQTSPNLFVSPRPNQGPAATVAEKQIASLKQAAKRTKDGRTPNVNVVAIDPALLAAPESLTGFRFNVGDTPYSGSGALESRTKDGFTWFGKVDGEKLSTVILVVRDGKVTGEVRGPKGLLHIVPLRDGNHAIAEIDQAILPPDHGASEDRPSLWNRLKAKLSPKSGPAKRSPGPPEPDTDDASASASSRIRTLSVLVGYTAQAREDLADLEGDIALAEQQANFSYKNSGVNIRLKVVKAELSSYDETKHGALLADVVIGYTELLKRRSLYGADIAVLLLSDLQRKDRHGNITHPCGTSKEIGADFSNGFVAVKASCLTRNASMVHEIGHIIGALHNWEETEGRGPCRVSRDDPDSVVYGHGLYSIPGRWATIMSYGCDPPGRDVCRRILYWSSPHVTDEFGAPMGHRRFADEARCLNTGIERFCSETSGAPCRLGSSSP